MPAGEEGTDGPVIRRRDGEVATIELNRAEAMNAITLELAEELNRALRELGDEARVILIRGAGDNFSVGGDFRYLARIREERPQEMRELFESFHAACASIAELRAPVIAAVEGYAMAGGFELMLACDFALVRADATIADNHANFGQVPAGGSSQRLPRLIGRQRALALILGGERLSGTEAVQLGLAHRAFAPEEFEAGVAAVAAELAAKEPTALATIKDVVRRGLETSLEDGIELEMEAALTHLRGAAAAGGIARFESRAGR